MEVMIYLKVPYTNDENQQNYRYHAATAFRNKDTGLFEEVRVIVFSDKEYNVGDTIKVLRGKKKNYFIPNKK